jgi:hypothetical protein
MRRILLVERDIEDREAKRGDVNGSVADERALGEDSEVTALNAVLYGPPPQA